MREAITNINNGATTWADCANSGGAYGTSDTINIPAGTYTTALAGANEDANATGDYDILKSVSIVGAGASTTIIDGGALDRVFDIRGSSLTVSFSGVTIRNGNVSANYGGGINANWVTSTVSVTNCIISGNVSSGGGNGGGISNVGGSLTVTNSTISGNTAANNGGGIYNAFSNLTNITNSTISGNTATNNCGGIYFHGSPNTLTNSTISGNTASVGGGFQADAAVTVTNSTIVRNSAGAGQGGGVNRAAGAVSLINSIVADNGVGQDCVGAITNNGWNIDKDSSCTGFTHSVNMVQGTGFSALASNGGPTQTHALLTGSAAINAGDNATCAAAPVSGVDQRGTTRPQGATCDIGAYELVQQSTVTPSAGAGGTINPSTPQTINNGSTTTFTVTPNAGYTASVGGTCGGALVGTTYTTNAITANCTVSATFTLNTYTVTPSAGTGGTISPSTPQTINYGSTTTFTVTPNAGYTASVGGTCGGSLSGTTYTTNAITANCTVTASFAAILPNCTYSVSTSTQTFTATGGSGSFNVNQNETSCTNSGWTAASSSSWVTITSGSSGTSSGNISYSVSQNTTASSRTGTITVTGHSNSATMTITQNALLTLSPSALNYGTLKTSESATLSVTVTNISGNSLTLSGVNITGANSAEFILTNNCSTLPNNGSCALGVKFMPTSTGSKTATLTVTANNVSFTTALAGTADNNAKAQINVTPAEINGNVDTEFGNRQSITISNTGTGTLLIQSIRFYGKDLYEYTVTGNCTLILPQGSCTILLSSAYTSNEAKGSSAVIVSNASNQVKEASMVMTSNALNSDELEIPVNMTSQQCISGSISISPVSATASSSSLTGGITVTAPDKCWWMASSNATWISDNTTNWFHGNGTVNYTVSANTGSTSRIGQIDVGGIPFTVIQYGSGMSGGYGDINGHKFEDNINALYVSGITDTTANFYPDNTAKKGDIASFIVRALYGEDFSYTTTPYFSDVPANHPYFKYVQKLKDDNITWAEGAYGIDSGVRRSWAAAFIIRAIYGETFSYPATPYFSDVPIDHAYFKYIQKMKERGFTHASGEYNPDYLMPRDALAAFISGGFLGMEH